VAGKVIDRDRGWADMMKRVHVLQGKRSVKVGVLADTERGGMHEPGGKLTIAEIAAVNEFGTEDGRIPARSFVRSTFDEMRPELQEMAKELIGKVVFGLVPVDQALGQLGAALASAIKAKITTGAGVPPPNAPSTALAKASKGKTKGIMSRAAKGIGGALAQAGALASVRTLVDTGRLVNAITWAIVDGSED
jgi:hypothetical protein